MTLGVTGGIGSGKSYICHLLEVASLPVFYSDDEARRIINEDPDVKTSIKALFGDEAYIEVSTFDDKGKVVAEEEPKFILDRRYIAGKIFSDATLREKMNAIVHPAVFKAFEKWRDAQTSNTVAVESAILFESGFDSMVDKTIVVSAPMEVRIERIKKRDGISEDEIRHRIESQCSDADKLRKADYIITNGPHDDVNRQIFALLDSIQDQIYSKPSEAGLVGAAELPL